MNLATSFEMLPAVDLRAGRVVRLRQGDFARETVYNDDPVALAIRFADAGARWLHVVDLDGARAGNPVNGVVIQGIVGAVGERVQVEVAGGLRTRDAVAAVLGDGAARAVIGTAALRDPGFAAGLVGGYGANRVAVALDVRDGLALGEGWRQGGPGVPVADAMAGLADVGVTTFEVTSIAKDGGLDGPDVALYQDLVAIDRGDIIASGGIATLDHLLAVRDLGCTGAIVGRALLDGSLDLVDAIARLTR